MSEKQERFFMYGFLFLCFLANPEDASDDVPLVVRLQWGIVAIITVKLLNRLLKWLEEWYLFFGGVILSNAAVYFIFHKFFWLFSLISSIYVVVVFAATYSNMKSHNKEYARFQNDSRLLPEYRTRTFSQQFTHWSKELQEKYK